MAKTVAELDQYLLLLRTDGSLSKGIPLFAITHIKERNKQGIETMAPGREGVICEDESHFTKYSMALVTLSILGNFYVPAPLSKRCLISMNTFVLPPCNQSASKCFGVPVFSLFDFGQ